MVVRQHRRDTDALGAEFTYRCKDVHYTKQKISEFVPNQRVVWHIEEAFLNFTEEPDEQVPEIAVRLRGRHGSARQAR